MSERKGFFHGSVVAGWPVLSSSQADDLVWEGAGRKVWVSRVGVADGMPFDCALTVEVVNSRGEWVEGGVHDPETCGFEFDGRGFVEVWESSV